MTKSNTIQTSYVLKDFEVDGKFSEREFHSIVLKLSDLASGEIQKDLHHLDKDFAHMWKSGAHKPADVEAAVQKLNEIAPTIAVKDKQPETPFLGVEASPVIPPKNPEDIPPLLDFVAQFKARLEGANHKTAPRLEALQEEYSELLLKLDADQLHKDGRYFRKMQGVRRSVQQKLDWGQISL